MKFRVWCKDYNEWEKDPIFLSQDGVPYHYIRMGRGLDLVPIRPEQHIVQFSTKSRDKNGREIYEGDIVKGFGDTQISNGNAEIKTDPHHGILFCRYSKTGSTINVVMYEYEVIGNIFENPDLLK